MGILALGIGFGTPLAIAGVVVHVAGHGIAKALGFYTAIPLLRQDPASAERAAAGRRPDERADGRAMAVSLALARRAAAVAAVRLRADDPARRDGRRPARGLRGRGGAAGARLPRPRPRPDRGPAGRARRGRPPALALGARGGACSPGVAAAALLALTAVAYALPGSAIVEALMRRRRREPRAASAPARRAPGGRPVAVEPAGWRDACRRRSRRAGASAAPTPPARPAEAALERAVRRAAPAPGPQHRAATDGRLDDDRRPRSRPRTGTSARRTTSTASDFDGHEPLRPLVAHPARRELDRPGAGGGASTRSPSGPIHAGVIESGHFRFHVVGERILLLDLRLFHKHRGLERAAEGSGPAAGPGLRPARLRRLRRRQLGRLRAGLRGGLGLLAAARAAPRPHAAARAGAALQPPQRHRRDLRRGRLRAREHGLRGAEGAGAAAQRRARRPPLPVRHGRGRRQPARPAGAAPLTAHAAAARAADDAAPGLARARASPPRSRPGSAASACSSARRRRRLGAVGPAARAAGVGIDTALREPRALVRLGLRARRAGRRRAATSPPGWGCGRRAGGDLRAARRAALRAARARRRPTPPAPAAPVGVARVESPRGETVCVVELRRAAGRAPAPAHRLLRQLAGAGPGDRGQPAARLPADQQELRALLRLRGPLTCSSCCATSSASAAKPACRGAGRRALARDPPRRRRLLQRLRARADGDRRRRTTTCSASASTSSPRRGTPTCCSSPAP